MQARPPRLFRSRSLSVSTAAVIINFFALFGVLFLVILYLQNVQGLSPVEAGIRNLPLSLAVMAFGPPSGSASAGSLRGDPLPGCGDCGHLMVWPASIGRVIPVT
jgi:hypothetical protein